MLKRIFIGAAALLVCAFSQAKYDAQEYILKNGLRVVFVKKAPSTVVYFSVWYKCGGSCDRVGKSGVAHFLEHMAFETDSHKFRNFLEKIGAQFNAFTSYRTICFYEIFEKSYLEEVIKNEARRLTNFTIDDKNFEAEKGAILQERNYRTDNNHYGAWQEESFANIFSKRAGGTPIVGWRHEIEAIKKEDLYDFYNTWFAPNNATVVVVGDVNFSEMKKLLDKYFQDIPSKKLATETEQPVDLSKKFDITYRSTKELTAVEKIIYKVPDDFSFREKKALKLAINILNFPSASISRQINVLTNNKLFFAYTQGELACDFVTVIGQARVNELAELEMLWRYFKSKVTNVQQKELDAVKKDYLADAAYFLQDDVDRLGRVVGRQIVSGDSLKDVVAMLEIIQGISLKECQDVLKKVFSKQPIAVEKCLPKGLDRE